MTARRHSGFTLVEVVVAFALLGLILAVAFEIFSTGLARAADLDDTSGALEVAQSQLAGFASYGRIPEGETRGESADGRYNWALIVRRYEEAPDPANPPVSTVSMFRVDVQVTWRGLDTRAHALGLSTVIVGQRVT